MKSEGISRMENSHATKSEMELPIAQQWINQHCRSERYLFIYFVSFRILHRIKINPRSRLGKSIIFIFLFLASFGLQITVTAIYGQWDHAPILTWAVIAIILSLIGSINYDMYHKFGLNVSSIGHTVADEMFFIRQIKWDRLWFSIRVTGIIGVITSISMLISILYINRQSIAPVIPAGNLLIICILSYQIGEAACIFLLMCIEARIFSEVDHSLFRFNPIETESIQRSLTGYSQFGLATSILLTVYIVCSAILLPNSVLINPVWLFIILAVYLILILDVVIPIHFVEQIVCNVKRSQLMPIRQKLNIMFDHLMDLDDEEYNEMLRLIDIQEMINKAPDSGLSFTTIGRIFRTLILPTIVFIATILGDAYISTIVQRVFN